MLLNNSDINFSEKKLYLCLTMYRTIEIDRNKLTIMGVPFSDLQTLNSTANAIGSNMFEGFEPTPKGVAIIRDYVTGKISFAQFIQAAKEKAYV